MDISVNIDPEAVLKRFEDMAAKIKHFKSIDIGATMSDWQVEDMHRNRPFTMRYRAKGQADTKIRPHSLLEMLKSQGVYLAVKERRRYAKAVKVHLERPVKRLRIKYREHRHWSTRDILRKELEQRLYQREKETLFRRLTWRPTFYQPNL
jgi:hypothetical protein